MDSLILTQGLLTVADFGSIRVTEDGRISVFDLINVCAEYKDRNSQYKVWVKLGGDFPDLLAKTTAYKFKGRAQKETPVCDRETALQIIGLLPGRAGRKYREAASKLVNAYLTDPEKLSNYAIDRLEEQGDTEAIARIAARTEGIVKRRQFTNTLKAHGVENGYEYSNITNAMTKTCIGKTATEIKKEHGVKNARDIMSSLELMALDASESLASFLLAKNKANGYHECKDHSLKAAQIVSDATP